MFASGYIEDALISLDLCEKTENSYSTIGIHPCRAAEPYIRAKINEENTSPEKKEEARNAYYAEIDRILGED